MWTEVIHTQLCMVFSFKRDEEIICFCPSLTGKRREQAGLLAVALVDEGDEVMQEG